MTRRTRSSWLAAAAVCVLGVRVEAQAQVETSPAAAGWTWAAEASAFGGFNYQQRRFTDFDAWESQNWVMGAAERHSGPWRTRVSTMLSFEPFTVADVGSPQAFQTGETFKGAPLIDYQHPHDLFMQLGAEATRQAGRASLTLGAALVGAPPIGPVAFMHRASAADNPQAPLSHHYLDSTHISSNTVHAALGAGGLRVTGGAFYGREPDEDRTDLDFGPLDSFAVQVLWATGPWSMQVSSAWLERPERLSPYDTEKRTASVSYERQWTESALAVTAAVGQNREAHGNLEAYLLEASWRVTRRWALYGRAETVAKDILDAGFHPVGVGHTHRQSQVGAITLGSVVDVVDRRWGRIGVGADLTGYRVARNLREAYGDPSSAHLFLRYRGRAGTTGAVHRH